MTDLFIVFLIGYFMGALSFAIIISKTIYKQDIRTFGSGNAGMTNMLRTFGKKAAAMTITGDALKGTFAVMLSRLYLQDYRMIESLNLFSFEVSGQFVFELGLYITVIGCVVGHMFPIYFKFKGGKGISVVAGAMLAVTPFSLLCALSVFLIIAFTVKIVSLASIVACLSYFIFTLIEFYITKEFSALNLCVATILNIMIIYAHRANVKRLLNGTEYKFGQNKNK